jgi:REP element-mobilizing transposase RayT
MGRPRKRHVQTELVWRTWGGKRAGAGRPRVKGGEGHGRRPEVKAANPLHVTLRVCREVGSLRRHKAYDVVRHALGRVAVRPDARVVQVSIQGDHLHLVIEADDRAALARGVAAFKISFARQLNRALGGRRGAVFTDRYHAEAITSPRQARATLAYVLNDWRHHELDRWAQRDDHTIDPFSSGLSFDGWRDVEWVPARHPLGYAPLPVARPRAWLLTTGWRRHGAIEVFETPGPPNPAWGGRRRRTRGRPPRRPAPGDTTPPSARQHGASGAR